MEKGEGAVNATLLHRLTPGKNVFIRRYWAVTNVEYIHKRTPRLMMKMIVIIWVISFLVSIAPSCGLKDDGWMERVLEQKICIVSQDLRYQIFATVLAFYVPLIIVLFLYWKIFQAAKSRIRKHSGMPGTASGSSGNSGQKGGVISGKYSTDFPSIPSSSAARCADLSALVQIYRHSCRFIGTRADLAELVQIHQHLC